MNAQAPYRDYSITTMFLNRLKWKIIEGEMSSFIRFKIDFFCFKFLEPFGDGLHYQFVEFLETMDLRDRRSIVRAAIWLYQHGAKFHLVFEYNREAPFWYNIKNWRLPSQIEKKLTDIMDQVMVYDLEHE